MRKFCTVILHFLKSYTTELLQLIPYNIKCRATAHGHEKGADGSTPNRLDGDYVVVAEDNEEIISGHYFDRDGFATNVLTRESEPEALKSKTFCAKKQERPKEKTKKPVLGHQQEKIK